jgi:hypothetical protein
LLCAIIVISKRMQGHSTERRFTSPIEYTPTEFDLKQYGLVPDLFQSFKPQLSLKVTFGGRDVHFGEVFPVTTAATKPHIEYNGDPNSLYTIMMVDPDAPSRTNPIKRAWLHWMVTDIPGPYIDEGREVASYAGPTPPKGSGPHRYVIIVAEQRTPFGGTLHINGRASFQTMSFINSHQLQPVAMTMFLSETK